MGRRDRRALVGTTGTVHAVGVVEFRASGINVGWVASRQAKHQAKKRLAGICSYGGCQDYSGWAYRCLKHQDAHTKRMRRRREAEAKALEAQAAPVDEEKAA